MSVVQALTPKPCCLCASLLALNSRRICPNPNSRNFSFFTPTVKRFPLHAASANPDSNQNPKLNKSKSKSKRKSTTRKPANSQESDVVDNSGEDFPTTIPRKPRRGRKCEATAVEDFVRNSLERTFESIRKQNSEVLEDKEKIVKDKIDDQEEEEEDDEDYNDDDDNKGMKKKKKKKMVDEEEDPNWPLDADVGWGIRASEYFEKHAIKNVVGEDGVEIDWEGEIDDNYVKEINCLEWESFAFHPSPLIVLVFERYRRATDNWKLLKELEKAVKVYWNAKDRLPPRTVKIDVNIERDLAYALKVREGPELLFLRGNRILYREKEIRTADELIHLIAHFYYNAKRPSWINTKFLAPYY